LFSSLQSHPKNGISSDASSLEERKQVYGSN
jgi:hypothetical protein